MIKIKTFLIISLIVLFFIIYSSFTPPTFAQESSSTATASADIRAKLQALKEEIASKANQLKIEMSKKLQNKVYLGTISSKVETTFVLNTKIGEKKIEIKDYTDYLGAKKVTFKTLAVGDFIIVLGDVDDKEVLLAKRIIKTQAVKIDARQTFFGKVTAIDKKTVTFEDKKGKSTTFSYDAKTKIKIAGKDGALKDIKVGSKIIAVLLKLSDNSLKARFIYLIPDPSLITPTLSPTPSPTPKSKLN